MPRDMSIPTLLFMDLESSGKIRKDLTTYDPGQPWAMQIGAGLCNHSGTMTNFFSHIIKANGRTTKEAALKVHGISARVTTQIGIPEERVLGLLADMLKTAPLEGMKVITYGDFDPLVISGLFSRFGNAQGNPHKYDRLWATRPGIEFINLMAPYCQQACKLPSGFESNEYKWPSLDESARILLGRESREGEHDAFTDMMILKDLYFYLQERGHFQRDAA